MPLAFSTCEVRAGALPSLSDLEALLEAAVAGENYTRAAELRDAIGNAMHDSHVAVRHVNNQFYKAFASGDMDAMRRLWGEGDHVQCCHPGVKNLVGAHAPLSDLCTSLQSFRRRRSPAAQADVATAVL